MPRRQPKRALIIAGPNGAGKTTFAREFLPVEADLLTFVNADLIATGLSLEPERAAVRAGRIMVRAIRDLVSRGEDFAFETVYKPLVNSWRLLDNSGRTPVLVDQGGEL